MPSVIKELMMKEIEKQFETHPYIFFSSFDKLTVSDMSELRNSLAKSAKRSIVIKHSLAKKVLAKKNYTEAEKFLEGSVFVTFGTENPQMISKTLVEFAKTNKQLAPRGVVFEDKIYDQEFIKSLARLPSRHELLTQVVVRVQSPISGFVTALGQLVRGVVVALNEIKKQKEAQPQTA